MITYKLVPRIVGEIFLEIKGNGPRFLTNKINKVKKNNNKIK